MAAPKLTGDPVIDKTIAELNKKFSREVIGLGPTVEKVKPLPTGSLSLDVATCIGGWPISRIVEVYGPEASGKTSLGLLAVAQFQLWQAKLGLPEKAIVVDAEHTMTKELFSGFGLDMDSIIFVSPRSASEALQSTMDLVKTGKFGFLMFDSIDAMLSDTALGKDVTANDMGGISKPLARFFREYGPLTEENGCTSYFVNQLKYNPGAGTHANPETTPGGTALKFYASMRLRMSAAKPSEHLPGAFRAKLKFKKNRCAPPRESDIEFDFIYAKGPDPIMDVLGAAKDLGVLAFAGPTLKFDGPSGPETISTGGAAGWRNACLSDPSLLDKVRVACLAKI